MKHSFLRYKFKIASFIYNSFKIGVQQWQRNVTTQLQLFILHYYTCINCYCKNEQLTQVTTRRSNYQ